MDKIEKPKKGKGDVAHAIVKAGLSAIPYVGASAAELLGLILIPPLERRRDEWIESIGEGLKELSEKISEFKLEDLPKNEAFITTAIHATQEAIRNHQKEKLEALRNAVLNAALPNPLEQDLQLMFLTYVDALTTNHLAILKFLNDPKEWGTKHGITYPNWVGGGASTALEFAFPDLRGKREIYDVFIRDLFSRGLITTDNLHVSGGGDSMLVSRTNIMGKQFLTFISSPLEK